eukprot:scaffold834_cov311-Prasinococcus_capsulatus_cf.AAC.8
MTRRACGVVADRGARVRCAGGRQDALSHNEQQHVHSVRLLRRVGELVHRRPRRRRRRAPRAAARRGGALRLLLHAHQPADLRPRRYARALGCACTRASRPPRLQLTRAARLLAGWLCCAMTGRGSNHVQTPEEVERLWNQQFADTLRRAREAAASFHWVRASGSTRAKEPTAGAAR